ncbi:MAG: hypothetical protein M5T61_20445 [Acidimicrobiia bacterium]|nr:hypothetical protein [Acidimicrobiia bacterium]
MLRTCEREALERLLRAGKSSQRDVQRARVVLLAAQGLQKVVSPSLWEMALRRPVESRVA